MIPELQNQVTKSVTELLIFRVIVTRYEKNFNIILESVTRDLQRKETFRVTNSEN